MRKASKASKVFMICGVLVALTACGQASQDAKLAQNITMGANGQGEAGKGVSAQAEENEEGQEPDAQDKGDEKEEGGAFCFVYEGASLIPGEAFDQSVLGECSGVSEVPSCAFEGNDRVYNYEDFELTANIVEEGERIYSIYLIDPDLSTTEGLCFGDSVEKMESIYGEGYELNGTSYVYNKGNTVLSIVTQNDTVVGIEYRIDE